MKNFNYNILLVKIDRTVVWVLLFSIFLYFISGYGMTKGIIDRNLAVSLHKDILPLIAITSFAIHTFLAIRLAFMRKRIWNKATLIGLFSIYLLGFLSLVYFELFSQPSKSANIKANVNENNQVNTETTKIEVTSEAKEIFTVLELAKYNGENGNPSYVAVDGVVYDLSSIFKDGIHFGHIAGQDLTDAFYIEHVKSQITKYPVVGKLQ